ncbi:carbon-phosphorus lyase complex subunit PhnI [Effusibacillus dendaii]|uniref:Uncharacterized protein n=1 Tax=Effusibacillus dendaii TaxID=2743772 RepID=A0A7I8D634_9BACL|nr:carbon-phosphorus lyase complex subunit PhnI [Effusibacillus dendaii]BCJ85555.1 hypothetical protein skT53_05400 [Effusibacillus dendaii]
MSDFTGRMFPMDFTGTQRYLVAMYETVQIALLETVLGILLSMPLGLSAARNITPHPVFYVVSRFLLNAFRAINRRKIRVVRRISTAFKNIPGGQYLGPTRDYTKRLLKFELADETEQHVRAFTEQYLSEVKTEPDQPIPDFPKVVELLRSEGLLEDRDKGNANQDSIDDITRHSIQFPASCAMRLQSLARGETGAMMALLIIDGIEASGFVSHWKLPHYVDFQAESIWVRSIQKRGQMKNEHLQLWVS